MNQSTPATPALDNELLDTNRVRLEGIARACGQAVAEGVVARVKGFPDRERILALIQDETLDSVPGRILWDGLGVEAAPIFVVYKLLHEALSSSPQFFRRAITDLMMAQRERFSAVFSREIIWSILATMPGLELPTSLRHRYSLEEVLTELNQKSLWRRSAEDIKREASYVLGILNTHEKFAKGFAALRLMQIEKSNAITAGNLLLLVPAQLTQYAEHVCALGEKGKLPELRELWRSIEAVKPASLGADAKHVSIPIDLLFTVEKDDQLHCCILARSSASLDERRAYRQRSLYTRYFLRQAFQAYPHESIDLRLAFYLDPLEGFRRLPEKERLFHPAELMGRDEFWQTVAGSATGHKLLDEVHRAAVKSLNEADLVQTLKDHFVRSRPPPQPTGKGSH